MYGQGIGTLSVYTRTVVNGPLSLVTKISNENDEWWRRASVDLDLDGPYQVGIANLIGFYAFNLSGFEALVA